MVGTLDLRGEKSNRSGAAKRRVRRARLAEAPTGDSTGDQTPLQGIHVQTPQRPSTSGLQSKRSGKPLGQGLSTSGLKPQEGSKPIQNNDKRQKSSHNTPENGQVTQTYLSGSFFLDPKGTRGLSLGTIWNFIKRTGLS